jgi:hypothetical protein
MGSLTSVGVAFREIKGKLFPSVGMKKSGEHIRVNFGQSPFVFDIDGMMSVSNDSTLTFPRISITSVFGSTLAPGDPSSQIECNFLLSFWPSSVPRPSKRWTGVHSKAVW